MIDLRQFRADPDRFKRGARDKGIDVDVERLLKLDEQRRALLADQESKRAEQKKISKEIGPQIGKLRRQLKDAHAKKGEELESAIRELEHRPVQLKSEVQAFDQRLAEDEALLESRSAGFSYAHTDELIELVATAARASGVALESVNVAEAARRGRSIEQQMKEVALQAGMAPVRRFVPERDGWWDGYAFEIDPDYPDLAEAIETRRRGL